MPSIPHRRVAVVAIASMFALLASSATFAKSSHSRSRAAAAGAASAAVQSSPVGGYYYRPGGGTNIYSRPVSRGNVIDNTAGWGDVGAR